MSFLPNQSLAGQFISITALVMAPLTTFFGRHYSRTLYFAQILYIFSMYFSKLTDPSFSTNLGYTWLSFMPSFTTNNCIQQDFLCTCGNLISPAIIWVSGVVGLLILIKILVPKFKSLRFLKVYSFYRGFFYWFFGPLIFYSLFFTVLAKSYLNTSQISAIIVMIVMFLIPFIELVATKRSQREQSIIWRRWINFMCHIQIYLIMLNFILLKPAFQSFASSEYQYGNNYSFIGINIPLVIYSIFFIKKYNFLYDVIERIFVFVQDAIIIAISNIFILKYTFIIKYNLDFFAITLVACIELAFLIPKIVNYFKNDDEEDNLSIYPENVISNRKHYPWPQFIMHQSTQRSIKRNNDLRLSATQMLALPHIQFTE